MNIEWIDDPTEDAAGLSLDEYACIVCGVAVGCWSGDDRFGRIAVRFREYATDRSGRRWCEDCSPLVTS